MQTKITIEILDIELLEHTRETLTFCIDLNSDSIEIAQRDGKFGNRVGEVGYHAKQLRADFDSYIMLTNLIDQLKSNAN